MSETVCVHDRLNEDGICRGCAADCRGFPIPAEPAPAGQPSHYDLPCPATKKVGDDVFYCTRRGHDDDNHTYSSKPVAAQPQCFDCETIIPCQCGNNRTELKPGERPEGWNEAAEQPRTECIADDVMEWNKRKAVAASPAEVFDPPCECAIRNSRLKQGVIGPHHAPSCPQYGGVRPENEPQRMARKIAAQPSPDAKVERIAWEIAEKLLASEDIQVIIGDYKADTEVFSNVLKPILRRYLPADVPECKGRKTTGDNNPGDCDWPFCDCDPKANKVIAAIQESGYEIVKLAGLAAPMSDRCRKTKCYSHGNTNCRICAEGLAGEETEPCMWPSAGSCSCVPRNPNHTFITHSAPAGPEGAAPPDDPQLVQDIEDALETLDTINGVTKLQTEVRELRAKLDEANETIGALDGLLEAAESRLKTAMDVLRPFTEIQPPYDHDSQCSFCMTLEGQKHPETCSWMTAKKVWAALTGTAQSSGTGEETK